MMFGHGGQWESDYTDGIYPLHPFTPAQPFHYFIWLWSGFKTKSTESKEKLLLEDLHYEGDQVAPAFKTDLFGNYIHFYYVK